MSGHFGNRLVGRKIIDRITGLMDCWIIGFEFKKSHRCWILRKILE
jgi:hypothetical protein